MRRAHWILFVPFTIAYLDASAESKNNADAVAIVTHTFRPAQREWSEENMRQLKMPPGFAINVFANELGNPRMMTVGDDGTVYVARREQGQVSALRDTDGDGVADDVRTVIRVPQAHGIALHNRYLYVVNVNELYRVRIESGGTTGKPEKLISDLPDGGQHPNRTIAFGPDDMLYITVGSTCNNCKETNPEHATMLRAQPDGSQRSIYAKGLRNTLGFGWHPETRELWGFDHGSDMRGDDVPFEELNRIVEGGDYGWPFCYQNKEVDPIAQDPEIGTKEDYCAKTIAPVLGYTAHSAPMAMVYYTKEQFPAEYRNDAFVAMRGSWNRKPASGYKVMRVRFENGQPKRIEDFISGFLLEDGTAHFARLCGLALASDGSLLVGDDTNGIIYRVSYRD